MAQKNANKSFTFAWKIRPWMQLPQPCLSLQIQQRKNLNCNIFNYIDAHCIFVSIQHIISSIQLIFSLPYRGSNIRSAISGLNRYKIALNEGNTLCKMRFPECVSGQLAVAVAENDNPQIASEASVVSKSTNTVPLMNKPYFNYSRRIIINKKNLGFCVNLFRNVICSKCSTPPACFCIIWHLRKLIGIMTILYRMYFVVTFFLFYHLLLKIILLAY